MTTHPQDQITKFWSMVAPAYEDHGSNVAEYGTDEYRLWLDVVGAVLPGKPSDVLDLATGTGFLALIAAELGHHVTGIDLSTQMLSSAERTARERGLDVRFATGDAVAPEVDAQSVDVVTNRHLLWTLREPETAMATGCDPAPRRHGAVGRRVLVRERGVEGLPEPERVRPALFARDPRSAAVHAPRRHRPHRGDVRARSGYSDVRAEYVPTLTNIKAGAIPYFILARP